MITVETILNFCNSKNYDLRVSRNARWIDQKCTPDVLWSIADFVLNYVDTVKESFSVKEIWESNYAKETIAETYSKPGTDEATARSEYDKVFGQPLNLLCYAGVLYDIGNGKRHLFKISRRDILEYIAQNDIFALRFLQVYIEKVLKDSGLITCFTDYFDNQDKRHFNLLKASFIDFYHNNTNVDGEYEPKRLFPKVLNPLAYKYHKKGVIHGFMSKNTITRADMMYNRDNFRDIYRDKPKDITRQEWLEQHPEFDVRKGYFEQMMSHNKKMLKEFNHEKFADVSEMTRFIDDEVDTSEATQIHHIFPKSEFPEIMHYLENLIALTPNQHLTQAHPNNNTHIIDEAVQKMLLIAKTSSIKENIESFAEPIYSFGNYLFVLYTGWGDSDILQITDGDYQQIIYEINCHY